VNSLERITLEYEMLHNVFSSPSNHNNSSSHFPPPLVVPSYLCIDLVPNKIRMMVTQWAPSNDPWLHQFIRGEIDRRILRQVAEFLARVNSMEQCDLSHDLGLAAGNRQTGELLSSLHKPLFAQIMQGSGPTATTTTIKTGDEDKEDDQLAVFARQMGQERFDQIMDAYSAAWYKCKILNHADIHPLNILVEPCAATTISRTVEDDEEEKDGTSTTATISTILKFGDKGEAFVCDWEFVCMGDLGRDLHMGAWFVYAALFLAARGETKKAYDVMDAMEYFWNVYSTDLMINLARGGGEEEKKTSTTTTTCWRCIDPFLVGLDPTATTGR
jgi:hypothetical protein